MKKVKIIIYTGGPDSQVMTFEYRHLLIAGRQFRFYNCEDKPNLMAEHVEPSEILDISQHHSFALEYL